MSAETSTPATILIIRDSNQDSMFFDSEEGSFPSIVGPEETRGWVNEAGLNVAAREIVEVATKIDQRLPRCKRCMGYYGVLLTTVNGAGCPDDNRWRSIEDVKAQVGSGGDPEKAPSDASRHFLGYILQTPRNG